jgi:predicted nucleic acid-binding protein
MVTNVRMYPRTAVSIDEAWAQIESWLSPPNVWIPLPTESHMATFKRLLNAAGAGKHVADAHLAAIAIEHGLVLCSSDRDFARYPELRWRNPLAS